MTYLRALKNTALSKSPLAGWNQGAGAPGHPTCSSQAAEELGGQAVLGWQEGAGSRGTLGSAKTQAWGGQSRQPVAGSQPPLPPRFLCLDPPLRGVAPAVSGRKYVPVTQQISWSFSKPERGPGAPRITVGGGSGPRGLVGHSPCFRTGAGGVDEFHTKVMGPWYLRAGFLGFLSPTHTSCVTLDKFHSLSVPYFSHLQNQGLRG